VLRGIGVSGSGYNEVLALEVLNVIDCVVCVFSVFNAGGSVCGCVCVYTHTHNTHCTGGVLGCEPRSWDETPGGPEESG